MCAGVGPSPRANYPSLSVTLHKHMIFLNFFDGQLTTQTVRNPSVILSVALLKKKLGQA